MPLVIAPKKGWSSNDVQPSSRWSMQFRNVCSQRKDGRRKKKIKPNCRPGLEEGLEGNKVDCRPVIIFSSLSITFDKWVPTVSDGIIPRKSETCLKGTRNKVNSAILWGIRPNHKWCIPLLPPLPLGHLPILLPEPATHTWE